MPLLPLELALCPVMLTRFLFPYPHLGSSRMEVRKLRRPVAGPVPGASLEPIAKKQCLEVRKLSPRPLQQHVVLPSLRVQPPLPLPVTRSPVVRRSSSQWVMKPSSLMGQPPLAPPSTLPPPIRRSFSRDAAGVFAQAQELHPGLTKLQAARVKVPTQIQYLNSILSLLEWMRVPVLPLLTAGFGTRFS